MADLEKLKQTMKESGMTIKSIAERAGIERHTLDRRLKGEGDFRASEIVGLTRALRLSASERNEIFLS